MNNEETCKTPLEDLRKDALRHYEEASSAISHWSSFVEAAIKAYNPAPPPPVQSDIDLDDIISKYVGNPSRLLRIDVEKTAIEYASLKTKELREEIERLKGLIEKAFDFSRVHRYSGYPENVWQIFKNENNL